MAGPSCMGRERNNVNVIVTALEYISIYLELDLLTKCHCLVELWEMFFFFCGILERVICVWCRCVVVINVVQKS